MVGVTVASSILASRATHQIADSTAGKTDRGSRWQQVTIPETQDDDRPTQPVQKSDVGSESDESEDLLAQGEDGSDRAECDRAEDGSNRKWFERDGEWQDYGDSQASWLNCPGPRSDDGNDEATSLFLQEESQVGEKFRDVNGDVWNVDYRIAKDCTWQIHNQATSQVDEATTSQLEQWDRVDPEESSSSEEEGQWISGLRIWFGGWLAVRRRGG